MSTICHHCGAESPIVGHHCPPWFTRPTVTDGELLDVTCDLDELLWCQGNAANSFEAWPTKERP